MKRPTSSVPAALLVLTFAAACADPVAPPAAPLEEQMALPDDTAALGAAIGGRGTSLGAASSRALGLPDDLPFELSSPVPVAEQPVALAAVAALALTTAMAMAWAGGFDGVAALVGRSVPGFALSPLLRGARPSPRRRLRSRRRRGCPPTT